MSKAAIWCKPLEKNPNAAPRCQKQAVQKKNNNSFMKENKQQQAV